MYGLIVFTALVAIASAGLIAHQPVVVAHSVPVVPVVKAAPVLAVHQHVVPVVPVVKAAPVVAVHHAPVVTKSIQSQSIIHPSPVVHHHAPVLHAAPVVVKAATPVLVHH